MIYDSILNTIGRTPVVRVNRLAPPQVTMYVKCEFFNPISSVKDRLAIAIIEDAERTGALKPGQTVVEATSGNTGIALAMVCAALGHPFVATMAESFSIERRKPIDAHDRRAPDGVQDTVVDHVSMPPYTYNRMIACAMQAGLLSPSISNVACSVV